MLLDGKMCAGLKIDRVMKAFLIHMHEYEVCGNQEMRSEHSQSCCEMYMRCGSI